MLELLLHYRYILLFFGCIFGGEVFIIPAVYLAIVGTFTFPPVIAIIIVATVLSDSVWYALGRFTSWEKLMTFRNIARHKDNLDTFHHKFKARALYYLFLSKFVYGTRILAQVLSGVHKIPYWKYMTVDTAAVLVWTAFLTGVGYILKPSFEGLQKISEQVQLFIFFAIIIIGVSLWVSKTIRKKW